MRVSLGADAARRNVAETITGLWTFANVLGLLTDIIGERTAAAGVTVDGLLIKDSGIPEAAVTAHEAALAILETQITDGTLLARLAATETITGNWSFNNAITLASLLNQNGMALATTNVMISSVTGDTSSRYRRTADGTILWGPGNAAEDTNLFRDAAHRLKTDDALTVALALTTEHDFIVPVKELLLAAQGNNIDMVGSTILYVDATGAQNISGFAGGLNGKIIAVVNRDATDIITLLHASAGSSAGNRMALPSDSSVAIASRQGAILMYNTQDDDWRIMSGFGL